MFSLAFLIAIYAYLVLFLGLLGFLSKSVIIGLTVVFLTTVMLDLFGHLKGSRSRNKAFGRGLRPNRFGMTLKLSTHNVNYSSLFILILLLFQALVNLLAMLGLVPLTGVPLPFVSYGGSSLVISLLGVGILLNISKHANRVSER